MRLVSPPFEVSLGNRFRNTRFKMMVIPRASKDKKAALTFRKARGVGCIHLKCEGELSEGAPPVSFRVRFDNSEQGSDQCWSHDFVHHATFEVPMLMDFDAAIDKLAAICCVCLEVLPTRVATSRSQVDLAGDTLLQEEYGEGKCSLPFSSTQRFVRDSEQGNPAASIGALLHPLMQASDKVQRRKSLTSSSKGSDNAVASSTVFGASVDHKDDESVADEDLDSRSTSAASHGDTQSLTDEMLGMDMDSHHANLQGADITSSSVAASSLPASPASVTILPVKMSVSSSEDVHLLSDVPSGSSDGGHRHLLQECLPKDKSADHGPSRGQRTTRTNKNQKGAGLPCAYYTKGSCRFGRGCRFVHPLLEPGAIPQNSSTSSGMPADCCRVCGKVTTPPHWGNECPEAKEKNPAVQAVCPQDMSESFNQFGVMAPPQPPLVATQFLLAIPSTTTAFVAVPTPFFAANNNATPGGAAAGFSGGSIAGAMAC